MLDQADGQREVVGRAPFAFVVWAAESFRAAGAAGAEGHRVLDAE
jgi:hypothetical protein